MLNIVVNVLSKGKKRRDEFLSDQELDDGMFSIAVIASNICKVV